MKYNRDQCLRIPVIFEWPRECRDIGEGHEVAAVYLVVAMVYFLRHRGLMGLVLRSNFVCRFGDPDLTWRFFGFLFLCHLRDKL